MSVTEDRRRQGRQWSAHPASGRSRSAAPVDRDKLRIARENAGLSRPELAKRIGKTARTVQGAETGEFGLAPATATAWAKACGVEYTWLLLPVDQRL